MKITAENEFWIDENGKVKYNAKCAECRHKCKQSFRAVLFACPNYEKKKAADTLDYMAVGEE